MSLYTLPASEGTLDRVVEASGDYLALAPEFWRYFGNPRGAVGVAPGLPTFSVDGIEGLKTVDLRDEPYGWTFLLSEEGDGADQRVVALAEVKGAGPTSRVVRFGWERQAVGLATALRLLAVGKWATSGSWLYGLVVERQRFTRNILLQKVLPVPLVKRVPRVPWGRRFLPVAPSLIGLDANRIYPQRALIAALRRRRGPYG